MASLRIGSLFSGYGGLDAAVLDVLGGSVAWHCEIEPAAARVFAHHYPDVPNLGDVTAVDWTGVAPVDVLTGGFPCQDVSSAGRRAGIRPGTRSGLWAHIAHAIDRLRPELVVIENVRGLCSADAACDVEPCPWCLGDDEGRPLRALGAVLGDLADLGYDARWCGLRAADVGAPHGRYRIFITAWPAGNADGVDRAGWAPAGLARQTGPATGPASDPDGDAVREQLVTERGRGGAAALDSLAVSGALLPTPTASDRFGPGTHGDGGADLRTTVSLLPTPRASDGEKGGPNQRGSSGDLMLPSAVAFDLGSYAPAIGRWELILGRPAPAPTQTGARGGQQLAPRFVEFLMGLPEGHVTAVPGLSRGEQLRMLGNGVVPQQAAAGLRFLLSATGGAVAA